MTAPLVSVVVLTFNRPEALARCLSSLAAQSLKAFEVVLVDVSDPSSAQGLAPQQDRLLLRHLRRANRGVAANRNIGAAEAKAPLLAFLDDDCMARRDWLAQLVEVARIHPGSLVGGEVVNAHPQSLIAQAGQLIHEAVDRHFNPDGETASFLPGLNFALPTAGFLALNGNDERFGILGAEDREFCRRWRASGRRIVKAPLAVVAHEHRTDLRGFLRQYFGYGRGAWRYHKQGGTAVGAHQDPVGSHLGLVRELTRGLRRQPVQQQLPLALLMVGWELANTAGFLYQAFIDARSHPSRRQQWQR